ncbi:uncharacterized protein LOC132393371 [Hypanus sabinus]|uniref:uncharacterized protein LOC132393371 n=1 Tax=Hypanus sabinus TaxID=79690 RepID=UPI0028C39F43|nr:uncharacterized protein LOC132393371 [Hypanus sabinus]
MTGRLGGVAGAAMGDGQLESGLLNNGWKFRQAMELIFLKYNRPFEDDLLINLEDMTVDTETGQKPWHAVDLNFYKLRKLNKNNCKKKSGKLYEADVSLEQSDKVCEIDVTLTQSENLPKTDVSLELCTSLRSQVGQATEVLKDGQYTGSVSKLQTSVSMGDMNVGDKYEIDVDMLAASNSNLGEQVVVECVGKTKDNPLITFTSSSNLKIGSSPNFHDCNDGLKDTISKELNLSSNSHCGDKDNSKIVALTSSQMPAKPLCIPSNVELDLHKFEDSSCDTMNLEETTPTRVDQTLLESPNDSSGLSNTTLIDVYPSMVASMSNLLDRTYKKEAALRLIQRYRYFQFNVCKSKANTTQNGIKVKVRIDGLKLKRLRGHSVLRLKTCDGVRQMQNKAISPKSSKTLQGNLDANFSLAANVSPRTVLQTNLTSETVGSKFGNLYDSSACCQPLPVSPCNPQSPVEVANYCSTRNTNVSPLNGSAWTNSSSLKSLSSKSSVATVESPSPRINVNHLQNAEQWPVNNSTVTQPDTVVAKCSRSPFERFLCSANTPCSSKQRHSISSAPVPTKLCSVQSLLKPNKTDAFESLYQNLVQNSICLSASMAHPSILNVHSVPRREIASVSLVTCLPSLSSRKRVVCTDQTKETSRVPLKRFRSCPESSSTAREYHCTLYSPRSKQNKEKIAADVFIKWENNRPYSNSATVLPVINSSGNTVSLRLSPQLHNRVCRKLDYSITK